MKRIFLPAVVLSTALVGAQPALAQSGCPDVDFDSSITSRFPYAKDACLGIQVRDGRQFAHFQAEIVRVSGRRVQAKFRLPNGDFSETYAFEVSPDARVNIQGRSYRWSQLDRGQELDIYVPPDQWRFHIPESERFEVSRAVTVYTPVQAAAEEEGAMLPSTASPLPLIGAAGGVLSVAGLLLLALSRRWSG